MHHLAELVGLLAETDIGGGHDQVGDLFGSEILDKDGHRVKVIDGDLEKALNLRTVQVHRQDAVGPRRLDAIGADASPDRDPRLVFLVPLGVGKIGNHRRDLSRAGAFERIDPEEQLDEVVVDRVIGPLNDEDVAAAHVFEHADENVALAEDVRLGRASSMLQAIADRPAQPLARTAGEDLQLAVGIRLLGRVVVANQRFVHTHGGRSS